MRQEDSDIYVIPPNFIETGTIFGGTIRFRNAMEALVIALVIGIPVFKLPVTLTTKIIIACLTVLPIGLFAIIGINGESLSSFVINFFVYLKNRRIVGMTEENESVAAENTEKKKTVRKKAAKKNACQTKKKKVKAKKEDFPEEFGSHRERHASKKAMWSDSASSPREKGRARIPGLKQTPPEETVTMLNPVAEYLPIQKVENGIIHTKDHRYVKIIEVVPINFLLRSAREQKNIIYSFVSYLKISPVKLQFKVLTRCADINRHLETIREEMKYETDDRCIALQKDYESLIRRIGSKEAITRRFLLSLNMNPLPAAVIMRRQLHILPC